VARVEFLTDGTVAGRRLFGQRARLLHGEMQQADRGEFAGSIMTVLAQVEGITAQVTAPPEGGAGKLFFTKSGRRKADVVDLSDLASIPASLDRLRDVYSDDIPVAQAEGSLSRHGILHGQELAFDTKINSTKCWSLLDVLVQWALPRGRERDAQVSGLRQSVHAGSQEVDDRGRRLDDREFKVTRSALYEVCAGQSSYARRNRAFDADQARGAKLSDDAMAKLGLPIPSESWCTPDRCCQLLGSSSHDLWLVARQGTHPERPRVRGCLVLLGRRSAPTRPVRGAHHLGRHTQPSTTGLARRRRLSGTMWPTPWTDRTASSSW